ncbi:hydroxyethylthiazole kinase [Gracilibacillus caseinilyticus]|uniref:Hydroxyethylthiazole kinase n=1 Tax=Gracilibacillus caseinilyticus TaxID=2932256 RepID=A0ABY4EZ44_9BACI|nr:hydroxyethylthiazole kinase [Gracilibacillus caseinilyticus]UOQ49182.1 hydroxyethylthiazole kinase [Gracilibacillus caseinilyticus]
MSHLIEEVRKHQPLIHNITNQVVMNFTANGLYAIGASPVMANAKEEVEEMATLANALVLNIGTLTDVQVEAMILAGKAANKTGTPVVFDPVGAGATMFRTQSAQRILEQVEVTCIRGNAGEIASLAGLSATVRGVDGAGDVDMEILAEQAYQKLGVSLAITGAQDILIHQREKVILSNGHPLLTKVTGTGCLLSSVLAAFLAVTDDVLQAMTDAISYYGVAAENAASEQQLPGSFQVSFIDQLFHLKSEEINRKIRIIRGA